MQKVFGTMAMGLGLTAFVAYMVASSPALYIPLLTTPLRWGVFAGHVGIASRACFFGLNKLSEGARSILGLRCCDGSLTSSLLLAYTGESVARVFLVTACMFGGMSLYGYVTKRDLSAYHSFFMMGLWGVILASLVNLFVGSSPLQMALSVVTVFWYSRG